MIMINPEEKPRAPRSSLRSSSRRSGKKSSLHRKASDAQRQKALGGAQLEEIQNIPGFQVLKEQGTLKMGLGKRIITYN